MDGVGFDFTQKDVLDIHYVQILSVYQLLERVYIARAFSTILRT